MDYYKQIIQLFTIFPFVGFFTVVIGVLAILFMGFLCIMLFLDSLYRPNSPQYPFNIILDRIIPLMAIFMPSFLILYLLPKLSYLEKFGYIIVIHITILIPLMYYWSNHRNWSQTGIVLRQWNNPKLYLDLTIALIYPALFGIFFSLIRFIRLGTEINMSSFFTLNTLIIALLAISIYPYTRIWIFLIATFFSQLKTFLWNSFTNIMISLLLILLKYKVIFKVLEKLHRFSFLWISFIICHPLLYKKTFLRIKIHQLYLNPYIPFLCIFIFFLLELILRKGQIYYSLYILIIIISLRTILLIPNNFAGPENNWLDYCCYSNYIYGKWVDSYYPMRFWSGFTNMRGKFNNEPLLTNEQLDHIKNIITNWEHKRQVNHRRNSYIFNSVMKKDKRIFKHRFRILYHRWTNIT